MFRWFEAATPLSVWFLNSGLCRAECVALVRVKSCHPSARHGCDEGMFNTWHTSHVTWHPGPSPASRSSSLARRDKKLAGRMWEASQSAREGLPCWCSGLFFTCSHLQPTNTHTHTQTITFHFKGDVTLLESQTECQSSKRSNVIWCPVTLSLALDVTVRQHHVRQCHLSESGRKQRIYSNAQQTVESNRGLDVTHKGSHSARHRQLLLASKQMFWSSCLKETIFSFI